MGIRWMVKRDVPRVLELDAGRFLPAWDESELLRRLEARNCIGMVYESSGERYYRETWNPTGLDGFVVYELWPGFLALLKVEGEEWARCGLRDKMGEKLLKHRRKFLVLEEDAAACELAIEFRTSDVSALATADEPDPAILADALQDAGHPDGRFVDVLRGRGVESVYSLALAFLLGVRLKPQPVKV